jgi:3-hydroxymyristoyl/3-hydroxydecanoyl-(acyl carrier protein) dehydratase
MPAVSLQIPHDHPTFAGHFPGRPLLPGVWLLACVLEAALADAQLAARVGSAPRLSNAKFLAPVRPGDRIEIHLADSASTSGAADRIAFEVRCGERVATSGQFEAIQCGAAP